MQYLHYHYLNFFFLLKMREHVRHNENVNYRVDVVVVCSIERVVFAYLARHSLVEQHLVLDIDWAGDNRRIHPCLHLLSQELKALEMSLVNCSNLARVLKLVWESFSLNSLQQKELLGLDRCRHDRIDIRRVKYF